MSACARLSGIDQEEDNSFRQVEPCLEERDQSVVRQGWRVGWGGGREGAVTAKMEH